MKRLGIYGNSKNINELSNIIKQQEDFEFSGFYKKINGFEKQNANLNTDKRNLEFYEFLNSIDAVCFLDYDKNEIFDDVVTALKNSKHILLWDDSSFSAGQIFEFVKLSREAGVVFQLGNSLNYHPVFQKLKLITGKPLYVEINHGCENSASLKKIFKNDLITALSLVDNNVKRTSARGLNLFSVQQDFITVQLEFDNGSIAHLKSHVFSSQPIHEISVFEKGRIITADFILNTINISKQKPDKTRESETMDVDHSHDLQKLVESFSFCIHKKRDPVLDIEKMYVIKYLEKQLQDKIKMNF